MYSLIEQAIIVGVAAGLLRLAWELLILLTGGRTSKGKRYAYALLPMGNKEWQPHRIGKSPNGQAYVEFWDGQKWQRGKSNFDEFIANGKASKEVIEEYGATYEAFYEKALPQPSISQRFSKIWGVLWCTSKSHSTRQGGVIPERVCKGVFIASLIFISLQVVLFYLADHPYDKGFLDCLLGHCREEALFEWLFWLSLVICLGSFIGMKFWGDTWGRLWLWLQGHDEDAEILSGITAGRIAFKKRFGASSKLSDDQLIKMYKEQQKGAMDAPQEVIEFNSANLALEYARRHLKNAVKQGNTLPALVVEADKTNKPPLYSLLVPFGDTLLPVVTTYNSPHYQPEAGDLVAFHLTKAFVSGEKNTLNDLGEITGKLALAYHPEHGWLKEPSETEEILEIMEKNAEWSAWKEEKEKK